MRQKSNSTPASSETLALAQAPDHLWQNLRHYPEFQRRLMASTARKSRRSSRRADWRNWPLTVTPTRSLLTFFFSASRLLLVGLI